MQTHVLIKMYLDRKQKSVPGFSLRALAGRLDISPSFLSRLMNGKKPVPANLLPKIARALDIEPELLIAQPKSRRAVGDWKLAEVDAARALRNWYFLPVLELTTLKNFDGRAETIASRLGLSLTTVEVAMRELISLGLVKEMDGRYVKAVNKLRITSSRSLPAIRKFHDEMLAKAQHQLRHAKEEVDFQNRLITGITISADSQKIQVAKQKLAEFLHELANELMSEPGNEVYHLSAQLFPLSKA